MKIIHKHIAIKLENKKKKFRKYLEKKYIAYKGTAIWTTPMYLIKNMGAGSQWNILKKF